VVMSSGYRQPFYFLSQYRNIPWLRSFMEYPTAQLHPETAKKYGIEDGDWIWIESPRGRVRQKARVTPGILRGMLMATANCFFPEEPAKGYHGLFISNPNVLTSNDHLDPMYGSPDLTCLLCKVYKCTKDDLKEGVFKTEEFGFVQTAGDEEATRAAIKRGKR
jgi:anaerobic selenocysteine-containing dehydrogenase